MNVPFAFRLPCWPTLGMGLAMAMLWLGPCEMEGAQSSFGNSVPPLAGALVETAWPVVGWGIQPTAAEMDGPDGPLKKGAPSVLGNESEPMTVSLRSARAEDVTNFGTSARVDLGPALSFIPPAAAASDPASPNGIDPKAAPATARLGNASFNQAAESLNAHGTKKDDISGQFETGVATPDVAPASQVSAWAIFAIVALVVMVAMAIGYYDNDRDDRQRRRSSRKSRRRHRPAS